MTPAQYVKGHYVTRELKRLGVTNKQLNSMRFTGKNGKDPFERWSFWVDSAPENAFPLVKAYCALKWLILENPPYSRDKEDAWRLVNDTTAAPTFVIGESARKAQRERSQKARGKVPDEGTTIDEIVRKLAVKPQHRYETAKELWPRFLSSLRELGLECSAPPKTRQLGPSLK